ncbi:MAG: trypsin-like peptidase domain-containing protein [Leptospiraceae bacterium]|nr:trypsin-like peptidase domain-containing protein [Leptospiraceae bacterium]MCB1314402.1 trypsin-like peptidase domain-containing protein [Leptospiraceae bacterium]
MLRKVIILICVLMGLSCETHSTDGGISNDIPAGKIQIAMERSVPIYAGMGPVAHGSGMIVAPNRIVTCLHVAEHAKNDIMIEYEGERRSARLLAQFPPADLALLEAEVEDFGVIEVVGSGDLRIGQSVFLIGSAYGLTRSFMRGYIGHLDRTGSDVRFPGIPFIQTDRISYPGNSGAGVFTASGAFIGINRASFGFAPGSGIGLTVPARIVVLFLREQGIAL